MATMRRLDDEEARKEGYLFRVVGDPECPVRTTVLCKTEAERDETIEFLKNRIQCPNPVVNCIG